jgi:hypothetical protein
VEEKRVKEEAELVERQDEIGTICMHGLLRKSASLDRLAKTLHSCLLFFYLRKCRVARCHIFEQKIQIWVNFWRALQWKMLVYFMSIWSIFLVYVVAIWYILRLFGIFFASLVYYSK